MEKKEYSQPITRIFSVDVHGGFCQQSMGELEEEPQPSMYGPPDYFDEDEPGF